MKTSWIYIIIPTLIGIAVLSYIFHWQGVYAYWPFLIILLCPLMMFGIHGGHGDHSHGKDKASEDVATSHKH